LVNHGVALMQLRHQAVARVADRAGAGFRDLSGRGEEALVVAYRPSVDVAAGAAGPGDADAVAEAFRTRLTERRGDELVRRTTLVGPHRDDLALTVEGLAARGFASHGEAWGAALCLRMAQARAVGEEQGEDPVLLLDDPFSGLDPDRRRRLAQGLQGRGQVLLAVPEEAHIPPGAAVLCVEEGRVVPG
jgi:DNA replication and repair protein RecF